MSADSAKGSPRRETVRRACFALLNCKHNTNITTTQGGAQHTQTVGPASAAVSRGAAAYALWKESPRIQQDHKRKVSANSDQQQHPENPSQRKSM